MTVCSSSGAGPGHLAQKVDVIPAGQADLLRKAMGKKKKANP